MKYRSNSNLFVVMISLVFLLKNSNSWIKQGTCHISRFATASYTTSNRLKNKRLIKSKPAITSQLLQSSPPSPTALSATTSITNEINTDDIIISDNRQSKYETYLTYTSNGHFEALGLVPELVYGLSSQEMTIPTPVQKAVIPRLLHGENLVMAASTGSGKTLAYLLPVVQLLQTQEAAGYQRQVKRPRCLILVPTRELARQVLVAVKSLSHYCKMSSCAVLGGEEFGQQKKSLDRLVDIVVGSPERLIQHKQKNNLFLSQVSHVIIDEVDTMLTQGFGADIRAILRSVLGKNISNTLTSSIKSNNNSSNIALTSSSLSSAATTAATDEFKNTYNKDEIYTTQPPPPSLSSIITSPLLSSIQSSSSSSSSQSSQPTTRNPNQPPAQLIMATATLTKAVKALLTDVNGAFNIEFNDPTNLTPRKSRDDDKTVRMKIVEVDGVHRSLPHVRHDVQEVKGADKILVLQEVLTRYDTKKYRTMIFCNTIDSARALDYALTEAGRVVQSYHGDLQSKEREEGLDRFRSGERQFLVCTDIAARGIDIPEVDHVIMFDFPLNPVDYLHRAGRCGRAGRKGLVTALVNKRDKVLSDAIQGAISRGLPIDELSSSKRDYQDRGKFASVLGRQTREEASLKKKRELKGMGGSSFKLKPKVMVYGSKSSSSGGSGEGSAERSGSSGSGSSTRTVRTSGVRASSSSSSSSPRFKTAGSKTRSDSSKTTTTGSTGTTTKKSVSVMDERLKGNLTFFSGGTTRRPLSDIKSSLRSAKTGSGGGSGATGSGVTGVLATGRPLSGPGSYGFSKDTSAKQNNRLDRIRDRDSDRGNAYNVRSKVRGSASSSNDGERDASSSRSKSSSSGGSSGSSRRSDGDSTFNVRRGGSNSSRSGGSGKSKSTGGSRSSSGSKGGGGERETFSKRRK